MGADPAERISVLVVDDHPMLRERVALALEADDRLECAGQAGDGLEALEMIRALHPDVVVLDIFMPRLSGDEVLRVIREEDLDLKVLVLTAYPVAGLHDALEQRPDALLFKQEPCARICEEVVALVRGDEHSPGREALRHATALAFARVKLTHREQLVLELVAEGLKVHEIAERLSISKTVVNALLQSTRAKLEVPATTAAVAKAYEVGLLKVAWA